MALIDFSKNAFTVSRDIRFSDSDPAGIVFFSEYFRMFNDLFEDWLVTCLGINFSEEFLVKERMFPLVHVEVDFKKARRMGQNINLTLLLTNLGKSSIHYDIIGHDQNDPILHGKFISCIASKKTMKTVKIPKQYRKLMQGYMETCDNG